MVYGPLGARSYPGAPRLPLSEFEVIVVFSISPFAIAMVDCHDVFVAIHFMGKFMMIMPLDMSRYMAPKFPEGLFLSLR